MPDTHGGMEECIRQTCRYTSQKGVENTVISASKNVQSMDTLVRPECRLLRFPATLDVASTPMSLLLLRKFKSLVQDADLIHYHFPWPYADLMHLTRNIKKPYIVTYQSDIVKQSSLKVLYAPLMRHFLSNAKAITVASPNYLKSSEDLKPYSNQCCVVPLGLDDSSYPPVTSEKLKYWKQKLNTNFFLFVGVFRYYKGLHFLIRALKGTSHHLVIAGQGPEELKLKEEAQALGVSSQITFTGFLEEEDKVALLQLCLGFVFPSHLRSEAFGISLLEAAMFSKPMISCEIGTGTTFINQNQETGIVVPPESPEALRRALNTLAEDKQKAIKMGENARRRYESIFRAESMANAYIKLYQKILKE